MGSNLKYITFLDSFDSKHAEQYGLTGRHLYDLTQLNIDVPNSFFVSSKAFDDFVHANNLKGPIVETLLTVDINNSHDLEKKAKNIQEVIVSADVPKNVRDEILSSYARLSGFSPAIVSVTYSPMNSDLDYSMFSQENFTLLNIKGDDDVIDAVKKMWASLFDPRAIFHREAKRYTGILTIGVVVQKLAFAEASGMLFTSDPITNDAGSAQIEAILGIIDPLLSSDITPDVYSYDKTTGQITAKNTVTQDWMLVRKGRVREGEETNAKINISPAFKKNQKLADNYIDYLGKLAVVLEKYNSKPLEAEWLLETGRISVTKVRSMTTLTIKDSDWRLAPTVTALKSKLLSTKPEDGGEVIEQKKEESKLESYLHDGKDKDEFEAGISAASEKLPDKVIEKVETEPMKAVATSVMGTATIEPKKQVKKISVETKDEEKVPKPISKKITTATKIYSEVRSASEVERLTELPIDGAVTIFGKGLLDKGIAGNLLEAASRMEHKPLIFVPYSNGALNEKELKKQLVTLKNVRNKGGKKNVWLAIPPFVSTTDVVEVKKLASTLGLKRSSTFKMFATVNNPAHALQIDDLIDLGLDGIMINYTKLVTLTLDRATDEVRAKDIITHRSLEKVLTDLVKEVHKAKLESIIVFDYLELNLDVVKKLVQIGVGGIATHLTALEELKLDLQAVETHKILSSGKKSK